MSSLKLLAGGSSLLLAAVCSCSSSSPPTKPVTVHYAADFREVGWDEQVAAVKSGVSDRIYLAKTAVGDDDLAAISDSTVRELLLDESRVTAAGLKHLLGCSNLEHLRLRGAELDDDALTVISQLKSLRIVNLPHGRFTDAGVAELKQLPKLVQVRLGSPRLTDASLGTLAHIPSVLRIHLLKAPLTDAGLKLIHDCPDLQSLYLDDTLVTEDGLRELFKALPELHLHVNQRHADSDPRKDDHTH